MTDSQKDRIREMKADGFGYIKIAQALGLSENTVKSFCRRKGLKRMVRRRCPRTETSVSVRTAGQRWSRIRDARQRSSARINAVISGGTATWIR